MDLQKTIDILRKRAESSKVAKDMYKALCKRERARAHLTIRALDLFLKEQGLKYPRGEYLKELAVMAKAGLGTPKYDKKGNVIALMNLDVDLASVGNAVLKGGEVKPFKRRREYLSERHVDAPEPMVERHPSKRGESITASITLEVAGQPVTVNIPPNLSPAEIGELISRLTRK